MLGPMLSENHKCKKTARYLLKILDNLGILLILFKQITV